MVVLPLATSVSKKREVIMKISINKSAIRVLSIALALVMLVGTLFTANITIDVSAETPNVVYWDGTTDTSLGGSGTADDPYLITNAAELAALAQGKVSNTAHYKVSGVSAFYLVPADFKEILDSFSTVNEIASLLSSSDITAWGCSATFQGVLDGNGATIYGMAVKGNVSNGGLFASAKGATIKNLGIEKSYVSTTNNAGAFFGQGNWGRDDTSTYSPTVTISSCVVKDCYIEATNSRGGLMGNAGYSGLVINNCLVADNFVGKAGTADGYPAFVAGSDTNIGGTINVPTVVSNSIGIGIIPKAGDVNGASHKEVINCYSTHSMSYSVSNVQLTSNLSAASLRGFSAKNIVSTLNWATDTQNGEGYWHVIANDYPTPLKPEGWQDIVVHPVWNGTAADSFAGGSGTEKDPYIIETAEQLYKMVRDGGKLSNGVAAYYKVGSGVTDLYLNNVQGGNLETLKSLVSAGTAKNWTKDFDVSTYKSDSNGDGLWDEYGAFTGSFDGNGVTIHGLYSTNKDVTTTWMAWGVGFVPALKYDAVIKNVNFDKAYVENVSAGHAGVITCSVGIDESEGAFNNVTAKGNAATTTNATIANVSVRNVYMPQGSGWNGAGDDGVAKVSKAGFVSVHSYPKRLIFINCLYDGIGSEITLGSAESVDYRAGIYMSQNTASTVSMINCVSIGLQPLTCSNQESKGKIVKSYTTDTTITNNNNVDIASGKLYQIGEYDSESDLPLLNWGIWSLETVENGRIIPMPGVTNSNITGYSSIKDMVLEQVGGAGLYSYNGANSKGTYGHFDKLTGSGTEQDPYLISTPLELATAIATGGKNVTQKLYYKLTNDINLGSLGWIDTETVTRESEGFDEYRYTPFEGVLDGDGYAIYELNASSVNSGALIPVLNGGTVKNLHLYNSSANTAIFATGNGNVENCSATNCCVLSNNEALVSGSVTAKNSLFDGTYYLDNGSTGTPTLDGITWYGIAGKKPQLVNRAISLPYADVDGDGVGDSYGATDLVALKNRLLKKQDYQYAYADVNGDGKVNSADLVALVRATANDYNDIKDGFWRNLELNNFKIYYGENDNYDAARKLELYLEAAVPGIDIQKVVSADNTVTGANVDKNAVYVHANDTVGAPSGSLEIIVGNIANSAAYAQNTKATADNSYAITYDKNNGILWLQGENFTAVEQAVLDFISKSNVKTSTVYTVDSAVLEPEKRPVTIDGTTYYYAWGDEFSSEELMEDTWLHDQMGSETAYEKGNVEGKYANSETAFNKDLNKLYVLEDGKLVIKRGAYDESDSKLGIPRLDLPDFGDAEYVYNELENKVDKNDKYVLAGSILTEKSMLVKQGYFEFKAALPSDGHAFMSWWMMGAPTGGNNNAYSESLYGKVYKLNPHFNGTNQMDSQNAKSTYKYQLPNSYFEIDIIELLQDITRFNSDTTRKNHMTGIYDYNMELNMHKYVDTGVNSSNGYKYSVLDWSTGEPQKKTFTLLEGSKYLSSNYKTVDSLTVDVSGSDNLKDGILSSNVKNHDFGVQSDYSYNATSQQKLTAMRRYGFEWEVVSDANGVGTSATYSLYVWDPDGDGESGTNDYTKHTFTCDKTTSTITYNEAKDSYTIRGQEYYIDLYYLNQLIPDCEVSNQYMHFIIDNMYYAANQYNGGQNFTDLLTYDNNDKTTLDIDYVRVYQQDGKRDIITPETEAFNNGNHFGY